MSKMTSDFVGAEHEFHSSEFALGWAQRFVPTPERLRLFEMIVSLLQEGMPRNGHIVELGMGPGYLADYVLQRMPDASYQGIDFSAPMLELAQQRLQRFSSRVTYTRADLLEQAWEGLVGKPVDAVVSTWALHDLGSAENIRTVYERAFRTLDRAGILVNGDFIKPKEATQEFEGGRVYVTQHLELLQNAGFSSASCLALFEEEIKSPTAAQNYACIQAVK